MASGWKMTSTVDCRGQVSCQSLINICRLIRIFREFSTTVKDGKPKLKKKKRKWEKISFDPSLDSLTCQDAITDSIGIRSCTSRKLDDAINSVNFCVDRLCGFRSAGSEMTIFHILEPFNLLIQQYSVLRACTRFSRRNELRPTLDRFHWCSSNRRDLKFWMKFRIISEHTLK